MTVTDVDGNEVTVEDISRIAVLTGDFAEIIFALGLGDNVVAVDLSATYPQAAVELPKIGYQRSLSAEGIIAMEPTLVIGGAEAGPPPVLEQLRAAGVTVLILDSESTVSGAAEKIRTIANALAVARTGDKVASALEADVEEAKELAAGATGEPPTAMFLYLRGIDTVMLAGGTDLSADMFELAGAVSAGAKLGVQGFAPLTAEALVATEPDYIVVFESGIRTVDGVDGLLQIPGIAETPAGRNRAILAFDGLYFSGGGPRTGMAMRELVEAFHGGSPAETASSSLPVTVTDAFGEEVTVSDVSRTVVLTGDFAEIVFALGLGENVVAVDLSATYPEEAVELPKIGYQRSLSAEGILAMEPTLVIGGTSAGPPPVLEQLRAVGVTVLIMETDSTVAGAAAKIRMIADAMGVSDTGETLASRLSEVEEAMALAADATGEPPTAMFVYLRGADTVMMAGSDDLSADMFDAAGAVSAGVKAGVPDFIPLTAESLVATAPDYIVVFESGIRTVGGVEGLLQIPGVAETPAGKNQAILIFDGLYFSGGGPRTGMALRELVEAFHNDMNP